MSKIRIFFNRLFDGPTEVEWKPVVMEEIRHTTTIGPNEELFLPVKYKQNDDLNSEVDDLPGITYRVNINKTQPASFPGMPNNFNGLQYGMEQFKLGLTDGYIGNSPAHNIDHLKKSLKVDQALSYPLRQLEQMAKAEGKKVWLDSVIVIKQKELAKLDNERESLRGCAKITWNFEQPVFEIKMVLNSTCCRLDKLYSSILAEPGVF